MSPELIERLDKWRARQEPAPPRSEAIRRLVEASLLGVPPEDRFEAVPKSAVKKAATINQVRKSEDGQ